MRKIVRISLGFLALIAGAILSLPGVPGPGIAIMILGLVILADYYRWARRSRDWLKEKAYRVRDRALRRDPDQSPAGPEVHRDPPADSRDRVIPRQSVRK
ncbi:MAG: PGPGW domain-containing protein [Acidobacteriota bacterium]